MASRITRGAAAKEATLLASTAKDPVPQQLSSPPSTRVSTKKKATPMNKAAANKTTAKKGAVKKNPTNKGSREATTQTHQVAATQSPATTHAREPLKYPAIVKKRKRPAAGPKIKEDPNELPHNLGKAFVPSNSGVKEEAVEDLEPPSKKRAIKSAPAQEQKADNATQHVEKPEDIQKTDSIDKPAKSPRKKSAKTKDNPYGLTPGVTPYPDWSHPTPEECYEVNDLLTKLHGKQGAPPKIPPPSLTITGCGEVPSILDALVRTLLSGNTTGRNSGRAMAGLVAKFGTLKEGIGKGSLDYNAIRRAPLEDVIDAIKEGGMQKKKGMYIKMLLDIVYEENKTRRDALVTAKDVDGAAAPKGAENETKEQKDAEIVRAEDHVLSLDHIHHLEKDDAITTMTKYPQIGVKTAACVVLFCMRIPCFAVDTHVFRLSRWLGWIPPNIGADPITTFRHLEVMIPDELKYSLHQLFIKHGKACPRCRAITGPNSEGWDEGCVIDHLVKRTGPMKEGLPRGKGVKGKKPKKTDDSEEDEELEEEALGDEDLDEEDDTGDAGKKAKEKGAKRQAKAGLTKAPTAPKTVLKAKPQANMKATRKAKNSKKLAENEEDPEEEVMDDEDAAMEDVANDIQDGFPKTKAKVGAAKASKRKAKVVPTNGRNNKAQAKTPRGKVAKDVEVENDILDSDSELSEAPPEESIGEKVEPKVQPKAKKATAKKGKK